MFLKYVKILSLGISEWMWNLFCVDPSIIVTHPIRETNLSICFVFVAFALNQTLSLTWAQLYYHFRAKSIKNQKRKKVCCIIERSLVNYIVHVKHIKNQIEQAV